MSLIFTQSEDTAAQRRFPVYLVQESDGITPATGEDGGQPQISKNGGAFANTSATLTEVSDGFYYVELTASELDTLGMVTIRYKATDVAEFNLSGKVVAVDPFDGDGYGLSRLDKAISALNDLAQSDVLSDGTPFPGADIDAAVSSRAAPGDEMDLLTDALDAAALAADAVSEIWDESITEPSAGQPPATPTVLTLLAWLWMPFRNGEEQTDSEYRVKDDSGTVLAEADVSDSDGTVTKSKLRAAD